MALNSKYQVTLAGISNGCPKPSSSPAINYTFLPYTETYTTDATIFADTITGSIGGLANPENLVLQFWAKNLANANKPDDYTWMTSDDLKTPLTQDGGWTLPTSVAAPDFVGVVFLSDFVNPDPSTIPTPEAFPGQVLLWSELPAYMNLYCYPRNMGENPVLPSTNYDYETMQINVGSNGSYQGISVPYALDGASPEDQYHALWSLRNAGFIFGFSNGPATVMPGVIVQAGLFEYGNEVNLYLAVMQDDAHVVTDLRVVSFGSYGYGGQDIQLSLRLVLQPQGIGFQVVGFYAKDNEATELINAIEKVMVTVVKEVVSIAIDLI